MIFGAKMEDITLFELIGIIERGTNIHIGVVFLGDHGSLMCELPDSHTIHSSTVCGIFKSTPSGLSRCIKCRNLALKRAIRDKRANSGLCINGIFEYTHPIVRSGKVIGVIFVGNILTNEGKEKLRDRSGNYDIPYESMEYGFSKKDCENIARLIEGHILMLLEKYPRTEDSRSALIDNVKSYVLSNLEYDHKLSEIASLFFYDEVYLGRLFRSKTGECFKDYLNKERVARAKKLLLTGITVTEVSAKVGYNSVTYFNRVFKKLCGMTPTEYKESNAKEKHL